MQSIRTEIRNCLHCGQPFPVGRHWQKFCSHAHQAAAKNLKRKDTYAELKERLAELEAENFTLRQQLNKEVIA